MNTMDDELLQKTKSKKRGAVMTAVVVIAFIIVGFIGFSIVGPGKDKAAKGKDGTVKLTVECKSLAKDISKLKKPELKKYVPKDGIILDKKEYSFKKDETVYDALEFLCKENNIHLETSEDTLYKSRYIEGINYLYEKDAGKNSGWVFYYNGKQPSYGASKVKLTDKAEIIWHYTVDYENDDVSM